MHHDIRPEGKGTAEHGRGKGIVHDQRQPVPVSQFGETLDIQHVHGGIGQGLAEHRSGIGPEGLFQFFVGSGLIHKCHFNAQPLQGHRKEVEGAPVNAGGTDHVLAALRQVQHGKHAGGLARRGAQSAHSALQSGDFLLHGVYGGIAQAGIEKARFGQIEQFGHLGRGVIFEGRALGNGQYARLAVFRAVTGVQAKGFQFHGVTFLGNRAEYPRGLGHFHSEKNSSNKQYRRAS